jgi:hypothetical protein
MGAAKNTHPNGAASSVVFAVAVVAHLLINVIGYAIGARKTWI